MPNAGDIIRASDLDDSDWQTLTLRAEVTDDGGSVYRTLLNGSIAEVRVSATWGGGIVAIPASGNIANQNICDLPAAIQPSFSGSALLSAVGDVGTPSGLFVMTSASIIIAKMFATSGDITNGDIIRTNFFYIID